MKYKNTRSSAVVFNLGIATPWGSFTIFLGVARASEEIVIITFTYGWVQVTKCIVQVISNFSQIT